MTTEELPGVPYLDHHQQLPAVQIGTREIYDQGLKTQQALERLTDKIGNHETDLMDHEARIRVLESARWPLPHATVLIAIVSLLVAATSALVTILLK